MTAPELVRTDRQRRYSPIHRLIEWTDLKGSLHNHSTWSDGRHTLDAIADHIGGS